MLSARTAAREIRHVFSILENIFKTIFRTQTAVVRIAALGSVERIGQVRTARNRPKFAVSKRSVRRCRRIEIRRSRCLWLILGADFLNSKICIRIAVSRAQNRRQFVEIFRNFSSNRFKVYRFNIKIFYEFCYRRIIFI